METSRALAKALQFLSSSQKCELENLLLSRDSLMPHEIANQLSITYEQALAFLLACELYGFAEVYLLIYHSCEPDKYIDAIRFKSGIPDLPFICENCEEEVETIDELSFDILASLKFRQKLIEELRNN